MNKKIIIVDYGVGNLWSLQRAFEACGASPVVSSDRKLIASADALVLPGVGSFEAGMRGLRERGLVEAVKKFSVSGKAVLGICLGAQLLMSKGYEFGEWEGLDIISGTVVRFPASVREKIPQVGWNRVAEGERVFDAYFVHSYILVPDNSEHRFGVTEYGRLTFCSSVKKGRVYGVQFHPEKSGRAGLTLISEFVSRL